MMTGQKTMMRIWLGTLLALCGTIWAQGAQAQGAQAQAAPAAPAPPAAARHYPTGLVPISPEEYDALPKMGAFRAWEPRHIDLSPLFPLPGDQYPKPDCTAWATAYSGLGYLRGRSLGHRPRSAAEEPSPAYVYNRLRPSGSSCSVPTRMTDALNLLKSEGTVSFAEFPDNPDQCANPVAHSLVGAQSDQRLGDFRAIDRERAHDWQSPVRIDDIKGALFLQQPVVFAMPAPQDFMNFTGSGIYEHASAESTNWHAMTVVGYDDERQAFRVINSWGTGWGDGGYIWIGYDTFKRLAGEAYALQSPADAPVGPAADPGLTPRQALDAQIAAVPCGIARLEQKGDSLTLTGFAGSEEALDTLHKALIAVDPKAHWAMDYHPWPQCEAETTLATPLALGGVKLVAETESGTPRQGDPVQMKAGDKFGISAETTAARPYLSVIYLQADGSAVTLYHGQPDPDRRGHRHIVIGTGGPGQVRFEVGAPFGAETVIAISSAQPLFGSELETYGTERQFLSGLTAKLIRAAPGTVSAALLRLHTQG